jgi:hypothetical protein
MHSQEGYLRVRSRIDERVFDPEWVRLNSVKPPGD